MAHSSRGRKLGLSTSSAVYPPCNLGQVTGTSSWASGCHLSAGVIMASRQRVVARFSLANQHRVLEQCLLQGGLYNVSCFCHHWIPAQGTVVPEGAGVTSHRGRQAALRLRASCMKEVRFSQLAEMWGKEPLAEGTAWRKTPSHKMASDGVPGVHVPPKRLGLDPANGGMWPLDGCWERFLALKNGQEGRRQGDQARG